MQTSWSPRKVKWFWETYKLSPKRLKAEDILMIQTLLVRHFKEVSLRDWSFDNCDYDLSASCPEIKKKDDEEYPFIGCGWNMGEAILSLACSEDALSNIDFVEELKYNLNSKFYELE